MSQDPSPPPFGTFCWDEVYSHDLEATSKYMKAVFGWDHDVMPLEQGPYHIYKLGDRMVGGSMNMPQPMRDMGVPPHWVSYIHVEDVDAKTAEAQKLGAEVVMPPMDIPNIGRFSFIKDPQGAVVALFMGPKQ